MKIYTCDNCASIGTVCEVSSEKILNPPFVCPYKVQDADWKLAYEEGKE